MNTIGIFYGSTTGVTQEIASRIAGKLNIDIKDVHEVTNLDAARLAPYDILLLGTSTWGSGELQDDWYDALEVLKKADLTHKTIALFGVGDSSSYSDTFCDAMGLIFEDLKNSGARFIGRVDSHEYDFDSSIAVNNDQFVGLALDEENEPDKTETRIENWIRSLGL